MNIMMIALTYSQLENYELLIEYQEKCEFDRKSTQPNHRVEGLRI